MDYMCSLDKSVCIRYFPQGQWMDVSYRLGLSGNASTASESSDPGRQQALVTVRPSGLLDFSYPQCFFKLSFCVFLLFHSCCSHARVFGKTLLHEFRISNCHTECMVIHSIAIHSRRSEKFRNWSSVKLNQLGDSSTASVSCDPGGRATARLSGHFFSCPLCYFPYSPLSSSSVCMYYLILAAPMRSVLETTHSCMSCTFPIAY